MNQENFIWAAQLSQTSYQSGSGADTLWVRIVDGSQWSAWSQSFTVTGTDRYRAGGGANDYECLGDPQSELRCIEPVYCK
jgi:hypothetical protein